MDKLTTVIKREYLREIIAGRKKIEYRDIGPYWDKRLASVECPFQLRLINGMAKNAPEVTVRIDRVKRNGRLGHYELHIGRVVRSSNWDKRRECPADD